MTLIDFANITLVAAVVLAMLANERRQRRTNRELRSELRRELDEFLRAHPEKPEANP